MYKRILVATDGSGLSTRAVDAAIDLAAATGAELVALNVVPRFPVSYFEGGVSIPAEEVARTEHAWADKAREIVDAARRRAVDRGVGASAETVKSDLVAESIVAAAHKHRCDLIVMASHGRKGLQRVLLGSETLQVLTQSTTPVLVLR